MFVKVMGIILGECVDAEPADFDVDSFFDFESCLPGLRNANGIDIDYTEGTLTYWSEPDPETGDQEQEETIDLMGYLKQL